MNATEEHAAGSIALADHRVSKIVEAAFNIGGMSGWKGRHLLNNLCSRPGTSYLEVGTWAGSTFCSALAGNSVRATAIDDWSQFQILRTPGDPSIQTTIRDQFFANVERFRGANSVRVIESDCFSVDPKTIEPIDVFFFDGDHSYEHQRQAVTHFLPAMKSEFIFVVDDYNWGPVINGTGDGIAASGCEVVWSKHLGEGRDSDGEGYWNGMLVAVLRKTI